MTVAHLNILYMTLREIFLNIKYVCVEGFYVALSSSNKAQGDHLDTCHIWLFHFEY